MIRPVSMFVTLGLAVSVAMAQNEPTAEQLQRSLDEAQAQLKQAQDRKNELATENQKLQKKLAETEQQLKSTREDLETLENRAYFLREHYAAWQEFLALNQAIRAMWLGYFNGAGAPSLTVTDILGDGQWPFSVPAQSVSAL